ncbi:hypothetical protein MKW98_014415 [Papaver atlanticum]|uniref:Uncharacterized protein n=1 Tax=Papaver atlanticum TaxID=357466 RepID=A0AAD4SPC7_9MAGN|nr:hypothetical protein MKW98_014415 [Papaver atlanticum]
MAARASTYWRTMLKRIEGNRMFVTSTVPKSKPAVAAVPHHAQHVVTNPHSNKPRGAASPMKGDYVPIYVTMGMVVLALTFGAHTAKQQLVYSPSVQVSKKKRETLPELEQPDYVIGETDKFIGKSFLRKVGHIQDPNSATIPNPVRGDIYTSPRKTESLKSVGL